MHSAAMGPAVSPVEEPLALSGPPLWMEHPWLINPGASVAPGVKAAGVKTGLGSLQRPRSLCPSN